MTPAPTGKERCGWSEDADGVWHSDCGKAWVSEADGTPKDHGMVYCYGCGKKLKQFGVQP